MVATLYALILAPIAIWFIAFGRETWFALERSETGNYKAGMNFVHASWEITHTLLVFSFTVFMMTHAAALTQIDIILFLPVCVFMLSFMVRGCLYLYLFYGGKPKRPTLWHNLFAITQIVSLLSVTLGALGVWLNLRTYGFTPDTKNLAVISVGFVLTTAVCIVPFWIAYQQRDTPNPRR